MADLQSILSLADPIRIASAGRALFACKGEAILASADAWKDPKHSESLFAGHPSAILAGSVPYRAMHGDITLFRCPDPRWTSRQEATPEGASQPAAQRPLVRSLRESPKREQFLDLVLQAIRSIEASQLEKVVLSRSHHLQLSAPVDPSWLFSRLLSKHHQGFVYQVPYLHQKGRGALVGASPELLLSRRGKVVSSVPLAGSLPRSSDPEENERRAARLLCSKKDLHEHALVVEHIRRQLTPLCSELLVPSLPSIVATPTMLHLGTTIRGELHAKHQHLHALALALQLHPTPALCGVPLAQAESIIDKLEPEDREFYGGTVGWMNAAGDGEWAVTIRCAHLQAQQVRLQAGVGIVRGSSPDLELLETDAKLQTMLGALGLAGTIQKAPPKSRPRAEVRAP